MADKRTLMAMMRPMTAVHNGLYKLTAGKVGGKMGDADILLLTTTGAKSGKERTTPLVYGVDGEDLVIIASRGGDDRHPGWYHNLVRNPQVKVRVGPEEQVRAARVAGDEDYERLWRIIADRMPQFEGYKSATSRRIPVVVLRPAA